MLLSSVFQDFFGKKKIVNAWVQFHRIANRNNNIQLNIKMVTLLVLNYLTRVQSEYYFSSDAYVNVIEKWYDFIFFFVLKRLV